MGHAKATLPPRDLEDRSRLAEAFHATATTMARGCGAISAEQHRQALAIPRERIRLHEEGSKDEL